VLSPLLQHSTMVGKQSGSTALPQWAIAMIVLCIYRTPIPYHLQLHSDWLLSEVTFMLLMTMAVYFSRLLRPRSFRTRRVPFRYPVDAALLSPSSKKPSHKDFSPLTLDIESLRHPPPAYVNPPGYHDRDHIPCGVEKHKSYPWEI
jgi:hypothetical protein